MAGENEIPTKKCNRCDGSGEWWSDCGDSTCDCGGTDYPCSQCGATGQVPLVDQRTLDALTSAGFEVRAIKHDRGEAPDA